MKAGGDQTYASVRLELEQAGTPIGPNNLLMAAHAINLGLTLVTDNVDEFARVVGLRAENRFDGPAVPPE